MEPGSRMRLLATFGQWQARVLRRECRGVVSFVLFGRLVAQRLMKSRSILERFDVLEHTQSRAAYPNRRSSNTLSRQMLP